MASKQETPNDGDSVTLVDEQQPLPATSTVNIGDPPSKWDRVVKCTDGHLYTTLWVPRVSLKAMRFGQERLQYCPVGRHWARATRVDETQLSAAELREAMAHHDKRII